MIGLVLAAAIAAQPHLSALLGKCPGVSCESDVFQPVWLTLHGANGEFLKVDTRYEAGMGVVRTWVYLGTPGQMFTPAKLVQVTFDCHGSYMPTGGALTDAPPNSLIGAAAREACKHKPAQHDTRLNGYGYTAKPQ